MPAPNPPAQRHLRSGSVNHPPHNGHANGMMGAMPGPHRFDGPRSPPNTSHVPCKFFRQGTCQAGNACPFSHDLGAAAETVCKYFAKGNCKFGPKCANIHILPDGRRVNYGKNGVTIGGIAPISLGSRVNPSTYHHSSSSALTKSFMRGDLPPAYAAASPYAIPPDDRYHHALGRQPSLENGLPTIDTTYSSNPASVYGSPREDDAGRLGLGLSPVNGLSVLDAPLPASFDSNGISHAARYGPWPASVPSKFGLESPSPSLNAARDGRTSETLKLLHTSAFGSSEHLSPSRVGAGAGGDPNGAFIGSSPSAGSAAFGGAVGLLGGEEYFGKRAMHSHSLRYAKPRLLSSSAPKVDRDWEPEFLFEEDYVPGALANEVLTPAEKARRGSTTLSSPMRGLDGGSTDVFEAGLAGTSGSAAAAAASAKFGSSATAASPSRWGPLFQRQKEEELAEASNGRPLKHAGPSFSHVGSPLRNSSLASGIGAELNGDSSGPHQGSGSKSLGGGSEPMSVLSQQLQRARLGEDPGSGSSSPRLHPHASRLSGGGGGGGGGGGVGGGGSSQNTSLAASIIHRERDRERALERHVSSGSIGSSVAGRFATPIDEEDAAFVFSMEEEDEAQLRARKRASGGPFGNPEGLGSGWSYAAAVAGQSAQGTEVAGVARREAGTTVETR